jgi:hypothetical protein
VEITYATSASEQLANIGRTEGVGEVVDAAVLGLNAKAGSGSFGTAPREGEQVHGPEYRQQK